MQGVSKFVVADFVRRLKISPYNKKFEVVGLSEYMENSTVFPEWDVVIATGGSERGYLNTCFSLKRKGPTRSFEYDKNDGSNQLRIGGKNNRILDPKQFSAGITVTPKQEADILARKDLDNPSKAPHKHLTAKDYLKLRETPILIIYAMELLADKDIEKEILSGFGNNPIMGYVIGFPAKESTERLKYRANVRKNEEIHKNFEFDDEDTYEGDEDDD